MAAPTAEDAITTLIFDIDDTLYDVGSGFTAHRNGAAVCDFMQAKLKFETAAAAKAIRDEYFEKYHATVKGLTVAEADGRLPAGAHFEAADLAEWWSTRLDFARFLSPDPAFIASLERCPLKLVAFTNAPRRYGIRVLEALGLRPFFPDARLFAVEDVMPHPKPSKAAFEQVLASHIAAHIAATPYLASPHHLTTSPPHHLTTSPPHHLTKLGHRCSPPSAQHARPSAS